MSDVIEDLEEGNQRRDPRSRGFLAAKISWSDGRFTVDCVMRDVSPTGARLKLPASTPVPTEFYLVEVRSGEIWEAKVAWRRHPEIGVTFMRNCGADPAPNGDVRHLQRLRIENLQRSGLD